jgi:hypothetical protein
MRRAAYSGKAILMSKTHPLGFRIERDLKEALVQAAKDDRRSVSSLVEILIEKWLRERGYLAQEEEQKVRRVA